MAMTWQNVIGFPGLNIRSILLNTTDFRRWWSSVALRSALKEKQNGREINMVALLIMNLIKLYRQRMINIFIMALIYIQVKKTGANNSPYNTNTYIQIPFRTPNNRRLSEHLPPLQSKARGPPSLTCWPEGRGHDYVGVFGGALRKDGSTAATLAVRKACMQKRRFWRLVAHSSSCEREREKRGKIESVQCLPTRRQPLPREIFHNKWGRLDGNTGCAESIVLRVKRLMGLSKISFSLYSIMGHLHGKKS